MVKNTVSGDWDVAQLVDYLPSVHEALGSIPSIIITWVWSHTSVILALGREVEAEESEIQGHTQLQSKFKGNIDYI